MLIRSLADTVGILNKGLNLRGLWARFCARFSILFGDWADNLIMKMLLLSICSVGLVFGQAEAHFKFSVQAPIVVAGTKLKPGEYKVDVEGSEASFKLDGKVVKVPASLQAEARAYKDTTMESSDNNVKAIHIGGTVMTVVFVHAAGGN
jgi:hypothetical protein